MTRSSLALALILAATPAVGQEWQVARESFAFAGSQLEISVEAAAPGTLRIIRGGSGSVRVASRSVSGFTAAGLGGERLTLTAAGPGPVDYMVSVPADVWIDVRLPGTRRGESVPGRAESRSFQWDGAAPDADPADAWLPATSPHEPLFTTYVRDLPPTVVSLPELANVRSLGVRIEGRRFRVIASRPLSVGEGSPDRLEIHPEGPPMDLVLTVPATASSFQLRMGGETALLIDGATLTSLCAPVTRQWLSDGRHWLTFTPAGGSLQCDARPVPRHEG